MERTGLKFYIAGPMRGIKLFNFPAFDEAAEAMRDEGHTPVSPADLDREAGFDPTSLPDDWDWMDLPPGMDQRDLFDRDMNALRSCDGIYMLPGWRRSVGASAEYHAARWLNMIVIDESETMSEAERRKQMPVATGVLDYFPDALRAVAHCSKVGNDQHNPGEPLHWSRGKSDDHADCAIRHFMQRGTVDSDGVLHSTKAAWRMLAILQLELEKAQCSDGCSVPIPTAT